MRIFISAGEPSGDLHAAHLVHALRMLDSDCRIDALGGHHLEQAGARLRYPLAGLPIVGLRGILSRIQLFRRLLRESVEHMQRTRTDLLVLVDYPGFNLRLAERAHRAGIRTVYYIGPQIWAWGARRINRIRRAVDLMLVVFEFERALYEQAGMSVRWVGHPLLDEMDLDAGAGFRRKQGLDEEATLIGLFPGSRPAEVKRLFPVMLETVKMLRTRHRDVQAACGMAPGVDSALYREAVEAANVRATLLAGSGHALMAASSLALVASGTATLETALFGTPQVVLYRTDPWTYAVARRVVRIPYIALASVVAGREVAREFIQDRCRPDLVADATSELLQAGHDGAYRELALELRAKLGEPGASLRAARAITELARI